MGGWPIIERGSDSWSAAKIGKLLGVDAIIVGSVTEFGRDDKSRGIGGIGAAAGYAFFCLVGVAYRRLRGRAGLGGGDAKLLAAAGAWVAWQGLPSVVLLGALTSFAVPLGQRLGGRALRLDARIPFGPGLCLGLWLVWLYGPLAPYGG
jgi:leader peptidase (prepilin peptidase)/N-methyltransferase